MWHWIECRNMSILIFESKAAKTDHKRCQLLMKGNSVLNMTEGKEPISSEPMHVLST